jgi:hypothetical protein
MMTGWWQRLTRRLSARHTWRCWLRAATALCLLAATATKAQQQSNPAPVRQPSGQNAAHSASDASGAITGQIITDDGRSAARATITVSPAGRMVSGAGSSPGVTIDEAGNFRVSGLAPGSYWLNIILRGYVRVPDPGSGNQPSGTYRPGDVVTIRMVKGGVITGRVTNSQGEPVIAARVQALRVATPEGNPWRDTPASERQTDDRGVYRLYGLMPGSYLLIVSGNSSLVPPHKLDAPTFYPSARREAAEEVTVRLGEEVSGIDIRYRGEPGLIVSGTFSGALGATPVNNPVMAALLHEPGGAVAAMTNCSLASASPIRWCVNELPHPNADALWMEFRASSSELDSARRPISPRLRPVPDPAS